MGGGTKETEVETELLEVETLQSEIESLKEQISQLESENEVLKSQLESETETQEFEPQTEIIGIEYTDVSIVRIVQETLNGKGYDCGTPDGVMGENTTNAIRSYQEEALINVNGVITDELLESLGIAEEVEELAEQEEKKKVYSSEFTYEQLARNPDTYIGEQMKFSGEVLQAQTGTTNYLRLEINSDIDTVLFITYDSDVIDYRLLEGDWITIYGSSLGTYSYEAVSGATITIPWIHADIIEMN